MSQRCPQCDRKYGPEQVVCVDDVTLLVPDTPEPAAVPEPPAAHAGPDRTSWSRAECWHCHTRTPDPANPDCLNPACRRSLTPPALFIAFRHGEIEVQPGERVELGRHGEHGHTFRPYPNVSRRHAAVGAGRDGEAWIEVLPNVGNGTFVNGEEVLSGRRVLHTNDQVRLAADAVGTVTLYQR